MQLLFSRFRVLIDIYGIIMFQIIGIQLLKNVRRIFRIFQRAVKPLLFGKSQIINPILQRFSALSVFKITAEQFLNIVIKNRAGQKLLHIIILQIALQFHDIQISPGTKAVIFSAPLQKFSGCCRKRDPVLQILIIYMDDLSGLIMNPLINLRFDNHMKLSRYLPFLIQLPRTNLDNLKRKACNLFSFSIRTLIPLQIKHDIFHKYVPISYFYSAASSVSRLGSFSSFSTASASNPCLSSSVLMDDSTLALSRIKSDTLVSAIDWFTVS